jgi:psiF repeat
MKKLLTLSLLSLFASGGAFAASDAAPNPQQEKMKACQAQATEKKLEKQARQDYVNTCLKAKPAKQESKMAMCNKKTAGLKGDERNKAQSECMKAA